MSESILWKKLKDADLVEGDAPTLEEQETPWYMKVLTGFSGWIAAIFIIGFLGSAFWLVFESGTASLVVGGGLMAAAYAVLRMPKNEFVEHLALAASLAGQFLFVWALFDILGWDNRQVLFWLLIALLQAVLAYVMPNFIHRVFSSFMAASAMGMSLAEAHIPYVFGSVVLFLAAWIWLNLFRYSQYLDRLKPLGYGLIFALIPLKGSMLYDYHGMYLSHSSTTGTFIQPWMGELLSVAVILYVVWQLLQRYQHRLQERFSLLVLAVTLLVSLVSLEAKGISMGSVIVLLGFAIGNRILLVLGIVSLLFYLSAYYYLLDISLLNKSQILLATGVLLLLARWAMLHFLSAVPGGEK
ncbi:MAG: DUF4401 domain-containing protein [Thiohalophilus sp.]|jgi:uncharacterized membrane protein